MKSNDPARRTLFLLALLICVPLSAATRASGQDSEGEVSTDEPILDPALVDAIETLEPTARARWPETFGGVRGDEETGVPIYVAFTEGADEKVAELAKDFPQPDLLMPVTVENSYKELEALLGRMVSDRDLVHHDGLSASGLPSHYDLRIDLSENAVVATVEAKSSLVDAAFTIRYGDGVLVEEGELGKPFACNSRADCKYTLRGGLKTIAPAEACSTGFVVKIPNGSRQILSAGHCGADIGDTGSRKHGVPEERYGEVRAGRHSGSVDAERHSIEGPFDSLGVIFKNQEQKTWDVTSVGTWDHLVELVTLVCQSGITTGTSCGRVRVKNYAPDEVPNSSRFVCAAFDAGPGDSGAPVYEDHEAEGILHGSCSNGPGGDPGAASFSHIEFIKEALDVVVVKES